MKRQLFTAAAVLLSLCGYAQTKGTNMLGVGVTVNTSTTDYNFPTGSTTQKQKENSFGLGYGHFINDNERLGVNLSYGHATNRATNESQNTTLNTYGGNLTYQHYYPLIGKLYAYAGGIAGYSHGKLTYDDPANENQSGSDNYSIGAFGGLTWFVNKRWAFETTLLSANAAYTSTKQIDGSGTNTVYENRDTNFNLKTDGFINNLGFKIYLMF